MSISVPSSSSIPVIHSRPWSRCRKQTSIFGTEVSRNWKLFSRKTRTKIFPERPCGACCSLGYAFSPVADGKKIAEVITSNSMETSDATSMLLSSLTLMDLDPMTAKLLIGLLGPFLSAFSFLFILRIVMSWYPKLPVEKFPYIIAYAPTEPILIPTRKVIPPLAGVDVTPVVWFGLISFLNEILVGPQGLLVLLSQKV